ncbi:type II toxin-antitoxin system RelE/ParE family toxin [Scytonema sp. NUACC26]|uniref:type II toxin-antitoxin system RelE/ParE family toxin n=1 Tax=Scytonema sp. NUACC26 TaxID=3140176 RepID=UPI0034DB913B
MSRYFFSVQAKQDLKQIVDRIARDNPTAARPDIVRSLYDWMLQIASVTIAWGLFGMASATCSIKLILLLKYNSRFFARGASQFGKNIGRLKSRLYKQSPPTWTLC